MMKTLHIKINDGNKIKRSYVKKVMRSCLLTYSRRKHKTYIPYIAHSIIRDIIETVEWNIIGAKFKIKKVYMKGDKYCFVVQPQNNKTKLETFKIIINTYYITNNKRFYEMNDVVYCKTTIWHSAFIKILNEIKENDYHSLLDE